jgi:CRISPR/Cas system-associated endonuclease Cas3-HD
MVASTIDKQRFTSLEELRTRIAAEWVNAQVNKERLEVIQRTIDEAIEKEGNKEWVIEFTEKEWRQLIFEENLPPIEQVDLLKKKIEKMDETKTESRKERGGIVSEIQEKAKSAITGVSDKVNSKLEELKGKVEEIKKMSGLKIWLSSLALSIGIGFYKFVKWISRGTIDMSENIKMLEMSRDFLRDPEGALKRHGAAAKEKVEAMAKEKAEQGGELIKEKLAPLAVLGGAGFGIFKLLEGKLPTKMANSLSGLDQKSLLWKLARNRALRLFGISGVTLFGIGKLYEYIEKNGASLGEMPTDENGKKAWWKKAIEKAGIGAKEGGEEIWSILNGEKLEEYLTSKENEEDMKARWVVTLEKHKTILAAKKEIKLLENRCEQLYNQHKDAFNSAAAFWLILKPWMFAGTAFKWTAVMLSLLKYASPGLIVPAGIVVGLTNNSIEGLQHIQVPESMWPEDIKDILNIPEMTAFLESHMSDFSDEIDFEAVAKELNTLEQKIKDFNTEDFLKKIAGSAAEKIIQTEQEKINSTNDQGIKTLIKTLEWLEIQSWKTWSYGALLGTSENPGVLKQLSKKIAQGESLSESDIRSLMEASEWTNISIFPRDHSKEWKTIQYVILDSDKQGLPVNICINPTLDHTTQYEAARDFVINEYELSALNVLGKVGSGFREMLSELTESIKTNNEKSGTLMEKLINNWVSILRFWVETYAVDYLGNKYFIGPWNLVESAFLNIDTPEGKIEMQEGLVEYGQGLAPVMVFTAIKRIAQRKWFWFLGLNWILESAAYPLKVPAKIAKWTLKGSFITGKYIFNRIMAGDYKSAFSDPKNQFSAYFRENIHKFKSLQKHIPLDTLRNIGGQHANISQLEKARKLLYEAKQSAWWREGKIKEAFHILEKESTHFEKSVASLSTDNNSIKKILGELESEIEGKKKGLGKLEWQVREHVAQNPDSLKQSTWPEKVTLDPKNPNHKKMMDNFMEKSRGKLQEIETERANASKLFKEWKITQSEYDKKMQIWTQREGKIMRLQEAIHLKLHGTPLHGTKKLWRFARGLGGLILTIGAVVGAQMAIEKWKADETDIPIPELDNESDEEKENEDRFYGFWEKESDKKKVGNTENWSEKIPENIKPFLEKIEAITAQYQLSFFCDAEAIAKASDTTIEENIRLIEESHDGLVARTKSLLKEYKEPLKEYWAELKKQWEAINIKSENLGHLNAFMAITEKEDWLYLESMNKTDVSETLWGIVDGVKNGWIGQRILETGMWLLPITSEIQDIQFAYREFSRGHIGDGFVHVWFFFLDTILDVASVAAGVVTAPAAGAGWVAVWAGAIGIRGALKQGAKWVAKKAIKWLKFEKIQWFVRVIGESEKFQKYMTPWLSGIRGKALRLPSGDLVNAGIDLPRSDSIKIDEL